MKDLFIPYKESLALKELGFDGKCGACYYKKFDNEIGYHKVYRDFNFVQLTVSAPTFSQAFKFFREKYNLDSNVMLYCAKNGSIKYKYFEEKTYKYYIRKSFKNPFKIQSDEYNTYEQAELKCLKKLIEIVKK